MVLDDEAQHLLIAKEDGVTLRKPIAALGGLLALSLLALFVVVQLVPYRVSNPPVWQEPDWDSPQTETLAKRACFDCHSNEVKVPWYGHLAPLAWVIRDHVDEGRDALNFSEMNQPQEEAHEASEEVAEGEMPPYYYLLLHPDARLTDTERSELERGLAATLGSDDEDSDDKKDDDH
jgi:hypothetical protein